MSPDRLLHTKLYPPEAPTDLVPRPRLAAHFGRLLNTPVTLVSAPAGYGKSTIVAQWVRAGDVPVAWLSLDEGDRDLRTFVQYLVDSVHTVFPDACHELISLAKSGTLAPVPVLASVFLNEVDAIDEPMVLVLDDYQRIDSLEVHQFLEFITSHPPPGLKLVVISRHDPPLPLARLRATGRLNEVVLADLRFDMDEVQYFLKRASGASVGSEALKVVDRVLEGWPAGLRLLALALRHQSDADAYLGTLSTDTRLTRDFLVSEVLDLQSPQVRDWLLYTSVLDRFSGDLCTAVCLDEEGEPAGEPGGEFDGDPDGESGAVTQVGASARAAAIDGTEMISHSSGLFLIPLDAERRWYRFHHLFRDLLRNEASVRLGEDGIRRAHMRASAWFESEGLLNEALDHALAAGDQDHAARIVESHRIEVLETDRSWLLGVWLGRLPQDLIRSRPELLLAQLWCHQLSFHFEAFVPLLAELERIVGDGPPNPSVALEVGYFRGFLLFFSGEGAASREVIEAVLPGRDAPVSRIRGEVEVIWGLAAQMQGDREAAFERLDTLLNRADPTEGGWLTRVLAGYAYLHLIEGNLAKAEPWIARVRSAAEAEGTDFASDWADYLQGLVHLLRNELDAAIDFLRKATQRVYQMEARACMDALLALALAYQARGDRNAAGRVMEWLAEYAASFDDPSMVELHLSARTRFALVRGEVPPPPPSGTEEPRITEPAMIWWHEAPDLTHCRRLLAQRSPEFDERALVQIDACVDLLESTHNRLRLIDALCLRAVTLQRVGRMDEAGHALARAMELGRPSGFIRPFIDAGPEILDGFTRLSTESRESPYVREIWAAFEAEPGLNVSPPMPGGTSEGGVPGSPGDEAGSGGSRAFSPRERAVRDSLTRRENEVLTLLAGRYYNREIAAALFVSPETVKAHLKNIYGKLGVRSRRDAVSAARALDLIGPTPEGEGSVSADE